METISLNLIPAGLPPVCHVSQFDDGRMIRANLFEGSQPYTLTNTAVVSVSVRKPDGHIVTASVTNTQSNYVEIVTTQQMTACAGSNLCELKIEDSGDTIGTLNFTMECELDPLDGGLASDSEINNLQTQVDAAVAVAVADQYDSNNVIFDSSPNNSHNSPYTVTSKGIYTALSNKANKTAVDNLLSDLYFNASPILYNTPMLAYGIFYYGNKMHVLVPLEKRFPVGSSIFLLEAKVYAYAGEELVINGDNLSDYTISNIKIQQNGISFIIDSPSPLASFTNAAATLYLDSLSIGYV